MSLDLGLEGSVVIVTGGCGQIGTAIVKAFLETGSMVASLDINISKNTVIHENLLLVEVDTVNEASMRKAWEMIRDRFQRPPAICVAAAALDLSFVPHHSSLVDMPIEQFRHTLEINAVGTFVTAKTWLTNVRDHIANNSDHERNVSFIIIGSEAGTFGVVGNADYAVSKSAVQYGLMRSLAPDAVRICKSARVNAIAPGAVDTAQFRKECAEDQTGKIKWIDAEATVATRNPVDIDHVARQCVMLASEKWTGSTTGQVVEINGGKSGRMYWDELGQPIS